MAHGVYAVSFFCGIIILYGENDLQGVGEMSTFVRFENVKKIYKTGEVEIPALHDVNFEIEKGEFCV